MTANLRQWNASGADGVDVANGDVTGLTIIKAGTGTAKYETPSGINRGGNDVGVRLDAPVDTDQANAVMTTTAAAAGASHLYGYFEAWPAAGPLVFHELRGSAAMVRYAISATGVCTCQNAAGSAPGGSLSSISLQLVLGTIYHFVLEVDPGTTTSNGLANARIYSNAESILATGTHNAGNFGTVNVDRSRAGDSGTVAGQGGMRLVIDQLSVDTAATIAAAAITDVPINQASVSLTPKTVTASAVAVTPVPSAGSVNLTPATVTVTAQPLPPSGMVSLTPNVVTLTTQTVTAQATTSVADNFNSYTAGAVLGTPWIIHPGASGTFTVQTGGGSIRATNTTTAVWTHPSIADLADGTIESDITFVSGSGYTSGVCGRVNASALTFYCARMNNSGALELVKSVAGTVTSLGQYVVNLAVGATIRVGLRMSGSTIVVTGNGVDRITVTDTSVTAAGRVGIRATGGSTTTAGLHYDNFAATAAAASAMPTTEISGYVIDTSCDFSEGDFAEGDIVMMTTGDLGKLDPTSTAGAIYASKWKTKATGAIPNETNSDYDATQTMSVVNGVLRMRQRWVSGRGKAGAIKPLLSGSNPNGENFIAYPRIRVRYRKTATPPTGSTAVGWGGIAIEMIGNSTDWANGGGEYGLAEGAFVKDSEGGSPLGVWVRPSNHLPNPNTYAAFYRADTAGAPSGENDWHIGELRSEPGRMRIFIDGVVIYDDTTNPPLDTDLFGLLSQNGKPGTPSAGTEGLMEWDWYVVSRYVGASLNLTTKTVAVAPVAVTPVPGAVTVSLSPITVAATSIAVSPVPGSPNATPVTVTVTAVAVTPVPQVITVNLATATATAAPVAVTPVPGLVTINLTPKTVTLISGNVTLLTRPYFAAADWLWNPIPASPTLDGSSAARVTALSGGTHVAALYDFGVTIKGPDGIDGATPRFDVSFANVPAWGSDPFSSNMPIPTGTDLAESAPPTGDRHYAVADPTNNTVYAVWQADFSGGTKTASWGAQVPLDGDGRETLPASSTGSNLSRFAAVIREAEIAVGYIGHALFFSSDIASPSFRYPAVKSDGVATGTTIPEGTRVQLDPSIDVAAIPGITAAEVTVARALQTFGAYCGDKGGARMGFIFEYPDNGSHTTYNAKGLAWDYFDMSHIPWSSMRVLAAWDGATGTATVDLTSAVVTVAVPQNPNPDVYSDYYLQGIYPVAIGGATLPPIPVTLSAVAVTPVPGLVSVTLSPATMTTSALPVDPQLVAPERDLSLPDIDVVIGAVAVNPVPGLVTFSLTPVTVAVTASQIIPAAIGIVALTPESSTLTTVAVTPVPQPVVMQSSTTGKGAVTVSAVAVTPVGLQSVMTATPATATVTPVAVAPVGQPGVVSLTPATVTVAAVVTNPLGQSGTVNLTPVTVTASAAAVSPVGQPGTVALTSRTVTASAVAVTPVGQPGSVTLTPATVTTSPVTVAPVGQPGVVTLSRPTVTLTTLPVSVTPGLVATVLRETVATVAAVQVTPVAGGVVAVTPKTVTPSAVAVTPVPGQATLNLTPATVTVTAQLVGAQARVDLTPAVFVLSTQAVTQTPGVVTMQSSTTGKGAVTVSAVAVIPVPGVMFIDATPESVTVSAVAVTPVTQPVIVPLVPVLVYASPWAVDPFPLIFVSLTPAAVAVATTTVDVQVGQVTTTLTTATVNLTTGALDPAGIPVFVTLTTAAVTVTSQALSVVPQTVAISLQTQTVIVVTTPLVPGAPVGEPILRALVAVLRDRGRYDSTMADQSNYEAVLT